MSLISRPTSGRFCRRACALAAGLGAVWASLAGAQTGPLGGSIGGSGAGSTSMRTPHSRSEAAEVECLGPGDCNDHLPCTADICANSICLHPSIPGCTPCALSYECPPVDLVFIMDTSGSMRDEAAVLCAQVFSIGEELAAAGINASIKSMGITELPGGPFDCLFDTVVGHFGATVPGLLHSCPFPDGSAPYESWGPATAIVAQNYPWTPGAARIIVPMSDEGPCNGSRPEGCNDPGDDRESIENAISVALANNVTVSPIAGTGSDACVINLGTAIAKATGGQLYQLKNPKSEFKDSLLDIIHQSCVADAHCDDREICTYDDFCVEGRCMGTPIDGCRVCADDPGCDDDNACTSDVCTDGFCEWTPIFGPDECCDPESGTLKSIHDANPCTIDTCDPETGTVQHTFGLPGTECDDELECTVQDVCNEQGVCQGTDINLTPCTSDLDCREIAQCDMNTGLCSCSNTPTLCLKLLPSTDSECHPDDEVLNFSIEMGFSPKPIIAGQFSIEYDPEVFDFLEIIPGQQVDSTSIFDTELAKIVNTGNGRIFFAVTAPMQSPGTQHPTSLAMLRLLPKSPCELSDPICFFDDSSKRTFLVSDDAKTVHVRPCCSTPLQFTAGPPVLSCPQSVGKNADAGRASAALSWIPPKASSSCDGPLQIHCTGINPLGMSIDPLAATGGRFAIGVSSFQCDAIDSCGATAECNWQVDIHDAHTVVVNVDLSAPMTPLPLVRCIELEFFTDCYHSPLVVQQPVLFGGLFNFPGTSKFTMKVPAGQYGCVTARDPLHTLRSTSPLEIVNDQYVIRFRGDPTLGGNWLVNGNLNGDRVIDILDHALLFEKYQARLDRSSTCEGGSHADLNGDGIVDLNDLAFIERSLYETDKGACCPINVGASEFAMQTELPILEYGSMSGMDLSPFDLTGDGMFGHDDIMGFLEREARNAKNRGTRMKDGN